MEVSEKEVESYVRPDGTCPFNEWLESLQDRQSRARIRTRINRVRLGNLGDRGSVGGGVLELKTIMGQAIVFTAGRLEQSWSFCCVAGTRVHKVTISGKLSNIGRITKVGVNDGEK